MTKPREPHQRMPKQPEPDDGSTLTEVSFRFERMTFIFNTVFGRVTILSRNGTSMDCSLADFEKALQLAKESKHA